MYAEVHIISLIIKVLLDCSLLWCEPMRVNVRRAKWKQKQAQQQQQLKMNHLGNGKTKLSSNLHS